MFISSISTAKQHVIDANLITEFLCQTQLDLGRCYCLRNLHGKNHHYVPQSALSSSLKASQSGYGLEVSPEAMLHWK